jgi:transposase-like protein
MVTNTTGLKASTEVSLIETGEKHDRLGRRITPRARREELVAAWRESGLTQTAFARREGIIYSSFASWVQMARLRSVAALAVKPAPAPVRFVEARRPAAPALAPSTFALCVRLPDGTELRGQQARDLAELLRILRS